MRINFCATQAAWFHWKCLFTANFLSESSPSAVKVKILVAFSEYKVLKTNFSIQLKRRNVNDLTIEENWIEARRSEKSEIVFPFGRFPSFWCVKSKRIYFSKCFKCMPKTWNETQIVIVSITWSHKLPFPNYWFLLILFWLCSYGFRLWYWTVILRIDFMSRYNKIGAPEGKTMLTLPT